MLYTLAGLIDCQEDINKSRFLAKADSIESRADALRFFAEHGVAAATHNCWAYRIGSEYRFQDDGEPGGTAGRPILQAIDAQQCDRVAVLVVRWFGGVKLGSGGLVRAYGGIAAQCLRLAPKVALIDEVRVRCNCPFGDLALVRSRLDGFQARIESETFEERGVCWQLAAPRDQIEPLADLFANLTRGQGQWSELGD